LDPLKKGGHVTVEKNRDWVLKEMTMTTASPKIAKSRKIEVEYALLKSAQYYYREDVDINEDDDNNSNDK
jgi:hypothetical protein